MVADYHTPQHNVLDFDSSNQKTNKEVESILGGGDVGRAILGVAGGLM
jgi:hypothetical protein